MTASVVGDPGGVLPTGRSRRAFRAYDTEMADDRRLVGVYHADGSLVLVETSEGVERLLGPGELDACGGDPGRFVAPVDEALQQRRGSGSRVSVG